jgi:hypothetical protein
VSNKELWAVHLDYGLREYEAKVVNTVPLGGSIGDEKFASRFLWMMVPDDERGYDAKRDMWEVDEDDLPFGYSFQTYYVARYEVES